MKKIFVTGTDTGVGKTVVCAGLCLSWRAHYFKPIQCGTTPFTDSEFLARFLPKKHIYPSSYLLPFPLSPNQAAQKSGRSLQKKQIRLPEVPSPAPLIIEGAGGAFVPFDQQGGNMADLIQKFKAPAIVVARSTLGTLNHTFLTLHFLRSKKINILGVILVGPPHPLNKQDIQTLGKVPVLLELPFLKKLTSQSLKTAFRPLVSFLP